MEETWRRKKYYMPRVLIDVARVLSPQSDDSLLCITGAQLEMLRNLTQYLHRRSTFVDEYAETYYVCADNEDFDTIQAIVADLEETLMGCDEITTALNAIAAQLSCLCTAAQFNTQDGKYLEPTVDTYIEGGGLVIEDDNGPTTPQVGDKCDLAQLVWWQAWEVLTETLQPIQDKTTDFILPYLMVMLTVMSGTVVLGIPVATFLALLYNLIEVWEEGKLQDLQNTFWNHYDELVCAAWRGLDTSYREAERLCMEVITGMEGPSPIDKLIFHCLCSPWAFQVAQLGLTNQTPWALSVIEAGACADCDEIEGSDWWALYLPRAGNTVHIDHADESSWQSGCWEYALPAGWITNGVILSVENRVGNCQLKRMSAAEAGCAGFELWGNTSYDLPEGEYFCVMGTAIDEAECKEQLCPDAVTYDNTYSRTGALTINAGFHFGWACEGSVDIWVKYLIMRGSPP